MAGIGKVSFPIADLKENLRSFLLAVGDQKPEGLKTSFFRHATLRSTMGPGIPVAVEYMDPVNARFMQPAAEAPAQ